MPSLIDLPTELLSLILEEVGGRELRRGGEGNKLLVCRKWYDVARSVYLSGLEFRNIRIFGHSIGGLNGKFEIAVDRKSSYSQLCPRLQKNTRQLRLRLLGHWWDEKTAENLEQAGDLFYSDYDSWDQTEPQNEPPIPFDDRTGVRLMAQWRDSTLRSHIDELFGDLRGFTALEDLVIEFSSEPIEDYSRGPHWDYTYHSTVSRLLQNLPIMHDLSSFTLDLCGTGLIDENLEDHLCERLAVIIPQIEHVRLRMRRICPAVFKIDRNRLSSPRVKTVVLKLHIPMFKDVSNLWSEPCFQMVGSRNGARLHQRMTRASQTFIAGLSMIRNDEATRQAVSYEDPPDGATQQGTACHGMTGFRMTYADSSSPCLSTIDFLTLRRLSFEEEFFAFEDEGAPCWFELAESGKRMRDDGPFVFGHS